MTKDEECLLVLIAGRPAGMLRRLGLRDVSFEYRQGYDGLPLSMSMPVSDGAYRGGVATNWFKGLLPGNELVIKGLAKQATCSTADLFSLIKAQGHDLPGAVQVLDDVAESIPSPTAHYEYVGQDEVGRRLRQIVKAESEGRPLWWASPLLQLWGRVSVCRLS